MIVIEVVDRPVGKVDQFAERVRLHQRSELGAVAIGHALLRRPELRFRSLDALDLFSGAEGPMLGDDRHQSREVRRVRVRSTTMFLPKRFEDELGGVGLNQIGDPVDRGRRSPLTDQAGGELTKLVAPIDLCRVAKFL